jgi:iron complex outermembrane receptor protein
MLGYIRYRTFLVLVTSLLLTFNTLRAHAQIRLDLPAQPLAQALTALGSLANLNIYFDAPTVDGIQAPALKAELSADEALSRLLAGTRLRAVRVDENTVRVVTVGSAKEAQRPRDPSTGQTYTQSPSLHLASAGSEAGEVGPGNAPDAGHGPVLEEIIVTAQKREERLIDVPISIVALSAAELQERNITSLDDLAMAVPGLSINSQDSYNRRIFLRGVSNLAGTSLIGLYMDEADITSGAFTQLDVRAYDLERIEVLRGPQGTLYGDGSAGGTIRFITRNPQLNSFAMTADVAALFTQDGAPSQRIQAMVNAPLIDNVLGLRIAGTFDHEGGWIDQPLADQKNINDQNVSDVRIKALWQPTELLAVNAMAVIHRNDAGINYGEDGNGNFTQVFGLTTTPTAQDDYNLYNLTVTYDFPVARLLSTTTYFNQDQQQHELSTTFQETPPGTPAFDAYIPFSEYKNKNYSEELRLTSAGEGPWKWTVGSFYRYFNFDGQQPNFYFGLPGPVGTPLPEPFSNDTDTTSKAWAVFGDVSYQIANRLTLGAGVREFEDRETASIPPPSLSGNFHAISPRAYAQFKVTDDFNVYTSAAKGFRSGGFNSEGQPSYGPETVWTYELGAKTSWLGGRLTSDLDVFHSDYTNYQILGVLAPPAPPIDITSNGGSARIKGVEWDFTWRPIDLWSLSLSGDYADSKFYEINVTSSAHNVGDDLDYSPKYTFTVSAQRDFLLYDKAGYARLDYNEVGHESYINRSIGPWYIGESDVIHMLNFNARIQWNPSLSLGIFAQNLLNDRGLTQPFSTSTTTTETDVEARSRPRTVGIDFGVKF